MQSTVDWSGLREAWCKAREGVPEPNVIFHPFTGAPRGLALRSAPRRTDQLSDVTNLPPRAAFLAEWRLAPERAAAALGPAGRWLGGGATWHPALLWDRLEHQTRSSILCSHEGRQALLSIALGPVQPFIAAARSLRDLWTGSTLLSWLAFQAIRPLIDRYGPTCLLFPVLRGNPLADLWLREQGCEAVPGPSRRAVMTPGLPHRIMAVVPWDEEGTAAELGESCVASARRALADVSVQVRRALDAELSGLDPDWAARWDAQIDAMLDVTVAASPLDIAPERLAVLLGAQGGNDLWPGRAAAAAYAGRHPDGPGAHLVAHAVETDWPARVELAGRTLEAARATRSIPPPQEPPAGGDPVPTKCTLLGTWEQVGPADRQEAARFWETAVEKVRINGVRLRKGERFCAQSLLKRFAMPAGLGDALGLDRRAMRFPDTATIAAGDWMEAVGLDWQALEPWSGQWLYRDRDDHDPDEAPPPSVQRIIDDAFRRARAEGLGAPPTYYAVIQCDGDSMGDWLRGTTAPPLKAFAEAGTAARVPDDLRVPAGPLWHVLLSQALADFATGIAPRVVHQHRGTLIYAGGDDVLAVLPARRALACAHDLRRTFSGLLGGLNVGAHEGWVQFEGEERDYLTLGPDASLSAGICIAHAKQDLRSVLRTVRAAEGAAKAAGRDAFGIMAMRRSGEHALAVADWNAVPWLMELVQAFADGASDRWAYRLRGLAETLSGLPEAAVKAEMRRQVDHGEDAARLFRGTPGNETAGARLAGLYEAFASERHDRGLPGSPLKEFLILCQTASFMARGRDH